MSDQYRGQCVVPMGKLSINEKKPIYLVFGVAFWLMALYEYLVDDSGPPAARWRWLFDLTTGLWGVHGYVILQCIIGTAFLCAAWLAKE